VKFRISICVLLLTAFATYAPATHAQTDGSPSSGGRSQWQAMRQEMMAACADKSAGTACSFSREGQAVSGTCRAMRQGQLACHAGKGGGGREMHGQMGGGMPPDSAPEEWHAL
jgi:hypothetical protein